MFTTLAWMLDRVLSGAPKTRPSKSKPKTVPMNLRFPADLRDRIKRFAVERGLQEATAVRVLCAEHLNEIQLAAELTRAEEWQLGKALEIWDRYQRGELETVSAESIHEVFEEARARRDRAS